MSKVNVNKLKSLAIDGFIDNKLRRIVWPILLNVKKCNNSSGVLSTYSHKYVEQVRKDIDRSYNHFDVSSHWTKLEKFV